MSDLLDDVLGLPDQLRDALWRVETARLEPADSAGLMICGMGGSAIGGDLAAAALGDRLTRPMVSIRGYELPSWATPEWTVLCSSYSGNTEETLACFEAAEVLGARRLVASTGGQLVDQARGAGVSVIGLPGIFQPRFAVAYMFAIAAEAAALADVGPRIRTEIDAAAAFLEVRRDELRTRAGEVAAALDGAATVVYGSDLTTPVARRWKTQINENAKLPAFWGELPEADHNEVCGWESTDKLHAVFIDDPDADERTRRRFEPTARIAKPASHVHPVGANPTERVLGVVLLGDLVSVYLAALDGTDPSTIDAIEQLKSELAEP
jgi:glucose/mannose-6-phosphate isomerase